MAARHQRHRDDKADSRPRPSHPSVEPSDVLIPDAQPEAVVQRARRAPDTLSTGDVLVLQRSVGNQAVEELVAEGGPP